MKQEKFLVPDYPAWKGTLDISAASDCIVESGCAEAKPIVTKVSIVIERINKEVFPDLARFIRAIEGSGTAPISTAPGFNSRREPDNAIRIQTAKLPRD